MRLIDLSLPIDEKNPEAHPIKIERLGHKKGIEHLNWVMMRKTFKGVISYLLGKRIIRPSDLMDEEFLSLEMVYCSVHTGTHVDAPYHFGTKCNGRDSKKIEDLPLEWFFSDGVVLNLTHKKPAEAISREDLKSSLQRINYRLKPKDIVLLHTGADKYFGTKDYMSKFCGVSAQAIEWLLLQGIKVVGIDALGFDRPYPAMMRDFLSKKDKTVLWPAHFCGRNEEYAHIERLANLDKLPNPFGFKVACFPVRVKDAGASFARVVAMVE
ncbi:MAG: cyclase family protein [Candidatus Omnitrophota bacterium]|nr:MAG: cyclase family protein [Candidatus Omnitrophota bacterium]